MKFQFQLASLIVLFGVSALATPNPQGPIQALCKVASDCTDGIKGPVSGDNCCGPFTNGVGL
ncbi:hypothetical protein BDQ17DRAFT_1431798 [Cyathus striatus]|nr:hypothetical protein BDQ17DRAFT_1431798 [Cyathus striatus]